MFNVILLTLAFSLTTVISVVIIGSRNIISSHMDIAAIIRIIFGWQFIVGALFAFLSRILFLMINSALYKIPSLAISSTTATTFITSISLVFVAVANYYFLGERINLTQGIGAFVMFIGIFLITSGR